MMTANLVAPVLADFRKRLRVSQAKFATMVGAPRASSLQRYCQANQPRSHLPWHIVKLLEKVVGKGEPPIQLEEVRRLITPEFITEGITPSAESNQQLRAQNIPQNGSERINPFSYIACFHGDKVTLTQDDFYELLRRNK